MYLEETTAPINHTFRIPLTQSIFCYSNIQRVYKVKQFCEVIAGTTVCKVYKSTFLKIKQQTSEC